MKLKYSSNNSGGRWWLKDEDWRALEEAGWKIDWYATREDRYTDDYVKYGENPNYDRYPQGRFLGALASDASKEVIGRDDANAAVNEWEQITGQNVSDAGCSCCGQPHNFSLYEEIDCFKCDRNEDRTICNYCGGTGIDERYIASFEVEEVRYKRGF